MLFDQRITIQNPVPTASAYNEPLYSWTHFRAVWAHRTDFSVAERSRAAEITAQITTIWTVRWSYDMLLVTPSDRIIAEHGDTWNILGIRELQPRNRYLEFQCCQTQE